MLKLNKKWFPYILILLLAAVVFISRQSRHGRGKAAVSETGNQEQKDPASRVNRDRGFDRRTSFLEYSRHATCRMECRHISQEEVEGIMKNGEVNYRKSDLQNARCPRYAVEGTTPDSQQVRIVFAQCNEKTEVVTVIDLRTAWECHCPGDDDKYKNRN